MGYITVDNNEWIQPGETKKAMVRFVMPEGYIVDLYPGLTWRIQEGANHVGNGIITYVIDNES